jgi:hypothetical protein
MAQYIQHSTASFHRAEALPALRRLSATPSLVTTRHLTIDGRRVHISPAGFTITLLLPLSLALSLYMVHNPPAEMTRSALRLWHMQCTCTYIQPTEPRHYSGEESSSGSSPRPCSSQLTAGYWLSTTPDVAPREGSQC